MKSIDTDTILDALRHRGERVTIQRRMVIDALCEQVGHHTLHELHEIMQRQGEAFDESTIYRILQWLNLQGVVSRTDLGERGTVYEVLHGQPHHHLVCLSCGKISEMDDSMAMPMRDRIRAEYHFEPRVDHMAIFGWCAACQQKNLALPGVTVQPSI